MKLFVDNSKISLLVLWFVNCPPCVSDRKDIANDLGIWRDYLNYQGISWENYKHYSNVLYDYIRWGRDNIEIL